MLFFNSKHKIRIQKTKNNYYYYLTLFFLLYLKLNSISFTFIIKTTFLPRYYPENRYDWEGSKELLILEPNEKCKSCNFSIQNDLPDSTKNDFIFASAINVTKNIIIFCRTLRTTGSKAQIVFVLDTNAMKSVSDTTYQYAINCGAQFINIGDVSNFSPKYIGYFAFFNLIEKNIHLMNRIIIIDLFDIVFQGDPFSSRLSGEQVQIADEGTYFNGININWTIQSQKNVTFLNSWLSNPYLCSGYIGGDAKSIYLFLLLFCDVADINGLHDQGLVNYLHFSGQFKDFGINMVTSGENLTIAHLAVLGTLLKSPLDKFGSILMNSLKFPSHIKRPALIVHHYFRNMNLSYSILESCPRKNEFLTDYHRSISDKDVHTFEKFKNY